MITFQGVAMKYPNGSIGLEDINLKIEPGEFVSMVGKSGAGKSTLIKLLIGEEKPTSGRILIGAYEVHKLTSRELPRLRRQVGVVFQDFKLLPTKNAYENVAFALEVEGRSQHEIEEAVPQMLDMVGLGEKGESFPHELSGGEKQRVAIARAMVNQPAVLIADEPTGNLDDLNTQDIINLLMKINKLGTTVLLATHSKDVVNTVNRRVISLSQGRIAKDQQHGKYIIA